MKIDVSKYPLVNLQLLMELLTVQHLHSEILLELVANMDLDKKESLIKEWDAKKLKLTQELLDRMYVQHGEIPE